MLIQYPSASSVSTCSAGEVETSCAASQILTINVEDYFQAGVFHQFVEPRNWYRFDSRLQRNIEDILTILAEADTRATFFVLGWIAEKHPQLVRLISDSGHEVASRGHIHQPLLKLSPSDRADDLARSRGTLEDVIGQEVCGFRLSDGWLRGRDLSFLDEVFDAGYRYDSSLMPRHRDFRNAAYRRVIHAQKTSRGSLLEVPLSTLPVAGSWLPISGGNYQRQLPDRLMKKSVQKFIDRDESPYVMYFQSWEMDSEQPTVSAVSRLTHIRHYRHLGIYRRLLPDYLRTWKFTSVREHAQQAGSPLAELTVPHRYSIRFQPSELQGSAGRSRPQEKTIVTLSGRTGRSSVNTGSVQRTEARRTDHSESEAGPVADRRPVTERKAGSTIPAAVTLVIPCYNEEGSLPYLSRTLDHLRMSLSDNYDLQVLFVDDCSRDNTREVLSSMFGKEAWVTIVHHEVNRGVSAAILTGLNAASTDLVCSIDCDCSYDPHELQHMLPLMKSGVAMVTASPYHRSGRVKNVPRWRLTLSHGLSVMYRLLLRKKLATWTSCFRVYRKSQILDLPLKESGFLGTAELAAQLCLHDRTIVEHPAVLEVRLFGASKMKTVRTILSHLRLLTRVAMQRLCPRLAWSDGE